MLNSNEYSETFGEDTVPYERFITPTDLNTRRVPSLKRAFNAAAYVDITPKVRPEVTPPTDFRGSASLTERNLKGSSTVIRGGWSASLTSGEMPAPTERRTEGPKSLRQAPERRWSAPRWQPGGGAASTWSSGVTSSAQPQPAEPENTTQDD
jgi:phycobilisome core-membrane linker protein